MTDIPLYDENDVLPTPHAKAEVRFTEMAVKPLGDGRRVRLNFKLTPFFERPSVDMEVTNAANQPVASLSLIEAMEAEFDFTIHLRGPRPEGEHTLRLTLFYPANDEPDAPRQIVDERNLTFVAA